MLEIPESIVNDLVEKDCKHSPKSVQVRLLSNLLSVLPHNSN